MKYIYALLIVTLFFIISCDKEDLIIKPDDTSIFSPDDSDENYQFNKIRIVELQTNWLLDNAKFTCEYGKIDHLENFFKFNDSQKVMKIKDNEIEKIHFFDDPYFSVGQLSTNGQDSINSIIFIPSGSTSSVTINLDYTNEKLVLIYTSQINISNKDHITSYNGTIIESYRKSDNPTDSTFIKILEPNGGESYLSKDSIDLSWDSEGVTTVNISISYDNSSSWSELASKYESELNSYKFKSEIASDLCLIKIEDASDANVLDISDSTFSIILPPLSDYLPLSKIKKWTYDYNDLLFSYDGLVSTKVFGTKDWEFVGQDEFTDSTKYLYKETFNYTKINKDYWEDLTDTTYHTEINYISITETKSNEILISPKFYLEYSDQTVYYNIPLNRYYESEMDSITFFENLNGWIYTIILEKEVGIKYVELYTGTPHAAHRKEWTLLDYQF